ncbi:hypothetical protein [Mycolicibacterium chubuense]|uniref:hypothetical protein n=1 Tax=Mycolicibacterium chubuense TaxID=1800 RepID=UPI0031B5AB13
MERAVTMIARRRRKVDDRNLHRLPDSADSDPREVLDYLQKYSGPDIPLWVLQADVCDALTLNNWLWWEDRRRELHFLTAARDRGLFLSQIGAQIGTGKQGVIDRIDRLTALLRYSRPDEKLTRAMRQSEQSARLCRPLEERWWSANHEALKSVVNALVAEADRYRLADDEREWIDQVGADIAGDVSPRAFMAELGLAVAELRTAPAVLALYPQTPEKLAQAQDHGLRQRPYRVHAVLADADVLRTAFAALSPTVGTPTYARSAGDDAVAG